jgi:hypothetical protein
VLVAWAGCFDPSFDSGKLQCSSGSHECPPGYACVAALCYKTGGDSSPDLAVPTRLIGDPCASVGECVTANCADGVCCDQPCVGLCTSCNLTGSVGTCVPVPAGGVASAGHPSCATDDKATCQKDGTCDGMGGCALWEKLTPCKASSCDASTQMLTPESTCDGKGSCVTPSAIPCSPYLCQDAARC